MHSFLTPPEGEPGAVLSAPGIWSQQRREALIAQSCSVLFELSTNGDLFSASPSATTILGKGNWDTPINFFERLGLATVARLIEQHPESIFSLQLRLRCADGAERGFAFSGERTTPEDHAERFGRTAGPIAHDFNNVLGAIRIKLETAAASDVVMADPIQIEEALTNLVSHAGQAMELTGGELTVRLFDQEVRERERSPHPAPAAGSRVFVAVCDPGHGIESHTQRQLFEPFFTARSARGGTGLGLTVVQAIMADHGGSVSVKGQPNRGATFVLSFPQADPQHR